MDIIDFHTHLYEEPNIEAEKRLSGLDVRKIMGSYVNRLEENSISHAVAIVMDEDFLLDPKSVEDIFEVRNSSKRFSLVFLLDPFREDFQELVDKIEDIDGLGVKFHPYQQQFDFESDSNKLRDAFRCIEDSSLLTIIDCNYAGEFMFKYNGVELGHAMACEVDSPIVLAHAGNARILDAFAVARFADNVWLDTSSTLPYWRNSSVGKDIAFCMEKMEMDRWLWGSDTPFLNIDRCKEGVKDFLTEHGLGEYETYLFGKNARELLDR